ncbi:MAG: flavodoxin-dependent (E)-4-hydroxy-3-methylbut-2-enyl-diphosphate synthase [Oscillospiraceae bacterium]|nr:flavodoxin-dependent (E)-4-hydroxy-3-methylbut-2-enyl-diphosphate synthase [Oscillospiraceae bacterium]
MEIRKVNVGGLTLGGGKIYIQSMLNVPADDVQGNVRQAAALEKAGCEIVRVSVPRMKDVRLIEAIKKEISIPLVADIHFDYKIALECASAGVDKIRINPGNIGGMDKVRAVADICREKHIPIRIGVNSGSLEKELLEKYGAPTAQALTESAMNHARLLEQCDFEDIVISIKSSDVPTMIKAYRLAREKCPYPLHLGVTEAGTERMGLIKSSVGIGSLLCDGIGETIRVSLTDDPIKEIYAAKDILRAIGMGTGARLIACPTCGRTQVDLIGLAHKVEELIQDIPENITVAVMGCIVNGPGEAREADVGIAGGNGTAIVFRKGQTVKKVPESEALWALMEQIEIVRKEIRDP